MGGVIWAEAYTGAERDRRSRVAQAVQRRERVPIPVKDRGLVPPPLRMA